MLDESRFHSMAASMAVRPLRLEGVFMALLFHHYVELTESSNALEEVRLKTKLPRSKPNK